MEAFFLKLLELSLSGSLFVLAVLVLRVIFRKAPKWIFCLLWGVVALRLVLPVSIESAVSLIPEELNSQQIEAQMEESYVGEITVIQPDTDAYRAAVDAGLQPVHREDGDYIVVKEGSLETPATVKDAVLPILSWVWLAGAAVMLAYAVISYLSLRIRVTTAVPLRENIKQSERIDSPFVLGLIRPTVYMPFAISDSDMENVIAHELAHIRRRDHWWKPIGFLILSVHWFNPVMWLAYILLCRDIEAACDEKVIQNMDLDGIRGYSKALLNCSIHRRGIAACPLAFGEVDVKTRIQRVMHYKKPAFWLVMLALVASVVAAVLLLTNPAQKEQVENQETESTADMETVPVTDPMTETVMDLVNQIAHNPETAASSNPYDYITAKEDVYRQVLDSGEEGLQLMLQQLRISDSDGLREYIMAAACAEITGVALDKELHPWGSGKQWLSIYDSMEGIPDSQAVRLGSLLGIDHVWMLHTGTHQGVGVVKNTYTFVYFGDGEAYTANGEKKILTLAERCLDIKTGDFDGDGITELFVYVNQSPSKYQIYDWLDGKIQEETYTAIPENVWDYDLLFDREGYYLYREHWLKLCQEPEVYIQQLALRPQDRWNDGLPTGNMPEEIALVTRESVYDSIHRFLDKGATAEEKWIAYEILLEMELSYTPPVVTGDTCNYTRLLEKWSQARTDSTEEKNCCRHLSDIFCRDSRAFLRGVAKADKDGLTKDLDMLLRWIVQESILYDAAAFDWTLSDLKRIAATPEENKLVTSMEAIALLIGTEAPSLDRNDLLSMDPQQRWNAFLYAPEQVIRTLGDTQDSMKGFHPTGMTDPGSQRLMDRAYDAVNKILRENPTGALKDVAYKYLIALEWYGGYRDEYVSAETFHYQRLFDKWSYSDGGFATMCYSQMYGVFDGNPEAFIRALSQWDSGGNGKMSESIALDFAYNYSQSETYQQILNELEKTLTSEREQKCLKLFQEAYQALDKKQ